MESNAQKLKQTEVFKMQEKSQTFIEIPETFNNSESFKSSSQSKAGKNTGFGGLSQSNDNSNSSKIGLKNSTGRIPYAAGIDPYVPYYLEKENSYWSGTLEKNVNNNVSKDRINTFVNPAKVNEAKNEHTISKLLEIITPKINSKFGYFDEYKNEAYEKSHVLQSTSAFYNVI